MTQITRWLFIVAAIGCCRTSAAADAPAPSPATTRPTNAPVAAVWFDAGYPPPLKPGEKLEDMEYRKLVVGVWSDGTVIWSDNRRTGGKPYHIGRIPNELVAKLLASLKTVGLFDVPDAPRFGPDSSYTVIAAQTDDGKRIWLGSWHDPPTTRPLVVVSEQGMGVIAPAQPRGKPSPAYAHFLEVWAESRRLIESVVPEAQGRPMNEKLENTVFDVGREKSR
jgi:hypothetical protein